MTVTDAMADAAEEAHSQHDPRPEHLMAVIGLRVQCDLWEAQP